MLDKMCVYRIVDDISTVFKVLIFLLHQPGLVTSLEDRSTSLIFEVVELAVELIEEFHSSGEVWVRCFNQEVVVLSH